MFHVERRLTRRRVCVEQIDAGVSSAFHRNSTRCLRPGLFRDGSRFPSDLDVDRDDLHRYTPDVIVGEHRGTDSDS